MGFAIAFVTAEIALRIHNPIRSTTRANDIVLPAFKKFVAQAPNNPKISPIIRIEYNSMGFRGPERPENFDELTSILAIGGSTTECSGLADGATWPDHLRRILDDRHPGCWLNNAGYVGHSTFAHSLLLDRYVSQIRPSVVVLLVGVNEVERDDLNGFDAGVSPQSLPLVNRILGASELLSTLQVLYQAARAVDLGVKDQPDLQFAELPVYLGQTRNRASLQREHAPWLDSYRKRLNTCINICLRISTKLVLITQPAAYSCGVDPTTGIDIARLAFHGRRSAAEQWRILELYNDITRQAAAAHGIPLIDLARRMPKDTKHYFDWVHYSLEGAEAVADVIGEDLIRILSK